MNRLKFIILSCLGATLEYYDFIIYGMMASYFTEVFFPSDNIKLDLLKTFSVLAVGYIARPLGGCLFGILSDIYGRRQSMLLGMSIMALMTVSIGLLPTYAQVGILSSILLVCCRLIQGLSFGAEIPAVTTMIKEYTHGQKAGNYFGWVISSTSIGALLASLAVFLISYCFTYAQIITWAWRIPFLVGALLAFVVYMLRRELPKNSELSSSENSMTYKSAMSVIKDIFKNHLTSLIVGIFITFFFSYLISLSLYLPIYLKQYFGFTTQEFFSVMTPGILVSAISAPIFGRLGDRFNREKLLQIIPITFLIFLFCALQIMRTGHYASLVLFILGYEIFISMFATTCLPVLADLFPANVRATGVGFCYNIAFSFAILCPVVLSQIIEFNNYIYMMTFFSGIVVLIATTASYRQNLVVSPSLISAQS